MGRSQNLPTAIMLMKLFNKKTPTPKPNKKRKAAYYYTSVSKDNYKEKNKVVSAKKLLEVHSKK